MTLTDRPAVGEATAQAQVHTRLRLCLFRVGVYATLNAGLNRLLNPFCKTHVLTVIRYGKCRSQNQWIECGWKMFSSSTRFDSEPRTTILDYFVNKKKKIVRLFVLVSHQVALIGYHGFGRNFVFFFFFLI